MVKTSQWYFTCCLKHVKLTNPSDRVRLSGPPPVFCCSLSHLLYLVAEDVEEPGRELSADDEDNWPDKLLA